jgi:hypothetical protein
MEKNLHEREDDEFEVVVSESERLGPRQDVGH